MMDEARTKGAKVHLASLMDMCHLKNAELVTKYQNYKSRVVFRGDIVKDDSGSYAVFTEQGSSASQMTAAKVIDVIGRLSGCGGTMEEAPSLLKIPKSECPDIWIRLPNTNGQNHGPAREPQSFFLNEICTAIFWHVYYGQGNSRKSY